MCSNTSASCMLIHLLMDGLPVHRLFCFVTLDTNNATMKRLQLLSTELSATKVNPCRIRIHRRWIPKVLLFVLGQILHTLTIFLVNLLECISQCEVLKMHHLEWCCLPSKSKALPALASIPDLHRIQDYTTNMHSLITVFRILHQLGGSPQKPTRRSAPLWQLQRCTLGSGSSRLVQWFYFYGFCTTWLCTIRLRNMVGLTMGKTWTRKIKTHMKRSIHWT